MLVEVVAVTPTGAGRTYLDVPFAHKDAAKAAGARWDPAAKSWYAPHPGMTALAGWAPLPDLLPGEDRSFGEGLFVDLVPRTAFFTNVRSAISPAFWDRVRKMVYRRAGYRCEMCGAVRDRDAKQWLEAHERWRYLQHRESGRLVQRLERMLAACDLCHTATHWGHARVTGREQEALDHLMHVNGLERPAAWAHVDEAMRRYERRSQHVWELDLSILTAAGIEVVTAPATERADVAEATLRRLQG